jgi:hypothetical protein
MAHGRIVEQGTHTQLLNRGGAYAQLLNAGDEVSEDEASTVVDLSLRARDDASDPVSISTI